MVALGIADPERVGVFGQSYGGYSVMGLLAQTKRFRAGVAIAGISELVSMNGQFDPTARGYPDIEHEKSANTGIVGQFGLHAPPWADPAGYQHNSPLSFVNKVETPLLLLHGGFDIRGAPTQSELFFQGLTHAGGRPNWSAMAAKDTACTSRPPTCATSLNAWWPGSTASCNRPRRIACLVKVRDDPKIPRITRICAEVHSRSTNPIPVAYSRRAARSHGHPGSGPLSCRRSARRSIKSRKSGP
ncbi:hypothetical protein COC42_08575 [Sphingomonas spermidinifaciens]|uniref:Peptidase S9 prolyl oligopeptidase catalytic domain-containing protein n=1 Tax=Sphingomonas spermidinifaciens TaxID=1141889 RepID=A0A2A4B960_9SPHN|nr:prolyl oligopeptidase family serine peptidase [Sphingomonas spermidinifaciens]PCD04319.1 hypothetical protein COC42_08575 [Sphingomonas spermidinifaciens]